MLAHALLNELFNVFPILFRVKVSVGAGIKVIHVKHDTFQYFSIKSYVADILTAAILVHIDSI